jgi:hypothetical protein
MFGLSPEETMEFRNKTQPKFLKLNGEDKKTSKT